MWTILASFLSGPLREVSNDLRKAYESRLAAGNDAERIAADERISLLTAREGIIRAAQSDRIERYVRISFAFPFIVYINKLILWDKVLALGSTDALSSDLTQLLWIIIGGYFLDTTVKGTAKILKRG